MAKSKKAVGVSRYYLEQTAKMIAYPVNIDARTISVPEIEVAEALENMTVAHLIGHGFKIQHCIEVEKKSIFDPTLRECLIIEAQAEPEFIKIGDKFRVRDSLTLEVLSLEGDIAYLKAPGTMQSPSPTSFATIKEMLKREVWTRLA